MSVYHKRKIIYQVVYRFDERKSDCGMPEERLSYAPVIAVMAAVLCALMIVSHFMSRCLPPLTNTFFIFNTNEDNRLCIDPVLIPPDEVPLDKIVLKKTSIIPVKYLSNLKIITQCKMTVCVIMFK